MGIQFSLFAGLTSAVMLYFFTRNIKLVRIYVGWVSLSALGVQSLLMSWGMSL